MPGPPPKPTKLKVLTGNPGRRPLNSSEPEPDPGIPAMAAGLTDAAQAEWNRIAPILLKLGVLTIVDGSELAAYCQSYARWLQAEACLDEHGLLVEEPVTNRAGDVVGHRLKKNPAATIASDMKKAVRAFASDFGLSPASRTRVHGNPLNDDEDEDDVDALLGK
jgi:P27 family predicted phage terminase small subunit